MTYSSNNSHAVIIIHVWCTQSCNAGELTELEVGFIRTDVVTAAEYTLHDESDAHGVEQTKLLRDVSMLQTIYHKIQYK